MTARLSDTRRAWLLLAAVALAWGINWPIGKATLAWLPAAWVVALRSALGVVALLAICALRRRLVWPRRADLPVIASVGVLHMTAFSLLVGLGLQHVPAGRSVVLAYTTPLWVLPGARWLLGEPLTARRLAGLALGLAGLLAIFNPLAFDWHDREAVLGNGLVLLAALCWAGSILQVRAHRWVGEPFDLVVLQALLATALLVPIALAIDGAPRVDWRPELAALLGYGAVFGIALAYWAVVTVNRTLPASTTALGLLGVPVVGVACSAVALGEAVSIPLGVAMALILVGIAVGGAGPGAAQGPVSRTGRRAQ